MWSSQSKTAAGRLILGVNCAYHESAAALICDSEVVFAIEEERLTRRKHAKTARVSNPDELPWNAIRACLEAAPGAALRDLGAIAYSLAPGRRLALIGSDPYELDGDIGFGSRCGEEEFNRRVLGVPHILARAAGDDSLVERFHFVPHHRAHAACAYHASPFRRAAILVVDGIGESSTAWLGRGSPEGLDVVEEIGYPHSIGMLWERVAVYLGFTEFDACKVMGLAAYGDPCRFFLEYDRLFRLADPDGGSSRQDGPPFLIDPALARLRSTDVRGLESLFGPRRTSEDALEQQRFADVAAGLQRRTDEAVLALGRRLARATGEHNLAYAGGVALNCLANARLEREGPFRSLFIFGAAHDAGTAIGAALDIAHEKIGVPQVKGNGHSEPGPGAIKSRPCREAGFLPVSFAGVDRPRTPSPSPQKRRAEEEKREPRPRSPSPLWGEGARRAGEGACVDAQQKRPALRHPEEPFQADFSSSRLAPLTPFLGPRYDDRAIEAAIARWGFAAEKVKDPADAAASLIADGLIVGWFQGRLEFGPRALGGRSLLADPRRPAIRDTLNQRIKHREAFRPFGASVLAEDAETWFEIPSDWTGAASCRNFMIVAYTVRPERAGLIPAVVHEDGTCRVQVVNSEQAPRFHALLVHFRQRTGVPLVLNTSFNDQEPLVATPDDALRTFDRAPIDALFLGDHLVRRER
jgi:carbamoyltransferase